MLYLIEILHQTTTEIRFDAQSCLLYLIEILHQTTTWKSFIVCNLGCILSKFYIKPQRWRRQKTRMRSCILSKFYIKPQLAASAKIACVVVSYRNSTSNHNFLANGWWFRVLYLIEILHQTTTSTACHTRQVLLYLIEILHQTTTCKHSHNRTACCILSKFYIKPQLRLLLYVLEWVVSYRNSTSNHNVWLTKATHKRLYLIEILHQTTTEVVAIVIGLRLYLIEILHQTTTLFPTIAMTRGCILSKFYIKPQRVPARSS